MKKTWMERRFEKLKRRVSRHRFLKGSVIFEMMVLLGFKKTIEYFYNNTKRFSSIVVALVFFIVSCSFALPSFIEVGAIVVEEESSSKINEKGVESVESILEKTEEPLIDESDIFDGYSDEVLDESTSFYAIDEILEVERTEQSILAETLNGDASIIVEKNSSSIVDNVETLDTNDWRLILINKQNPVPEDYTFELGTIKGSMKCDERILPDLLALLQGAKEDGTNLVICSPYRDFNRQEVLFDRHIQANMNRGLSYMEAYAISSKSVTVPGASEHQIGLAIDIVCNSYQMLNDGFGETVSGKWLAANAHKYGFILRYPQGKEYITGIGYEPWHFRYVGIESATVIKEQGLTLEEFVGDF